MLAPPRLCTVLRDLLRPFLNGSGSLAMTLCLVAGCSTVPAPSSSAIDGLSAACFDLAGDGQTVHLFLGQSHADDQPLALRYYNSQDAGLTWTGPIDIPAEHAPPGDHQRGNDPQIAAHRDRLIAVWSAEGDGPFGSGPLGVALSDDRGQTWRAGPAPAEPTGSEQTGYRFPAVAADDRGFHVIWIHASGEERSLRYARLPFDAARWTEPTIIDATSCACCWNQLEVDANGRLFALYRDAKPRDLAVATSGDGGDTWQFLRSVGAFGWHFDGCPHVGGGLALLNNRMDQSGTLCASVWTGQSEAAGAYLLSSSNGGRSWTNRRRIAPDETERHTDVATLSPNWIAVAWDQTSAKGTSVHVALTRDTGVNWENRRQLSAPSVNASHPRIIACDKNFLVFWTEQTETGPRIRLARFDPLMDVNESHPTRPHARGRNARAPR